MIKCLVNNDEGAHGGDIEMTTTTTTTMMSMMIMMIMMIMMMLSNWRTATGRRKDRNASDVYARREQSRCTSTTDVVESVRDGVWRDGKVHMIAIAFETNKTHHSDSLRLSPLDGLADDL